MKKPIFGHTLIILLSSTIGIFTGLYKDKLEMYFRIDSIRFMNILSVIGELFILFLQLIAIPVIVCAVISGLGKLIRSKECSKIIRKIIAVFVICIIICAGLGMALGFYGQPGLDLDDDTKAALGRIVSKGNVLEVTFGSGVEQNERQVIQRVGIVGLLTSLITPFGIIVFLFLSIIMGVAVGFLRDESALLLINTFSSFLNVFKKLVKWSLNFLPIALICLFAGLAASFDIQLFMVMFKFIILCCAGAVFIFIICTAIILIRSSKTTVHRNFAALLEPIILTFAGCSSKAVLPSAINCLEKELKFNSTNVNLALPLGIILGRFGNIFYFALCAFFTAQIYGFFFEPVHYFIIFGAVILAGTATAGVSGIITLSMFGIVLRYLNLPLEAVLILLIAIDPVIKPLRTFFNIYVNMACVSLIAKQDVKIIQSTIDNKKLLVFIHEAKNKPPLLTRVNGVPGGIEISFINEIGRRLDRKVVYHDKDWIKDKADIIAGVIIKDLPPAVKGGYYFSHPWTSVNINGVKTQLYFLIRRQRFKEINGIIKTLINENYLKKLLVSLKPKNK